MVRFAPATGRVVASLALIGALTFTACGGDGTSASSSPSSGGSAPAAAFSFSPTAPTAAQNVQFTDASIGSPTTWSWIFGDGATSTAQHPGHAFTSAGTFTISLTAGNARGSTTSTRNLTVTPVTPTTPASFGIVLGRPTDSSIVASVMADAGTDVYLEYDTTSGSYQNQTPLQAVPAAGPAVVGLTGLRPDTRYYYRTRYRLRFESDFRVDTEHSFVTRRLPGNTFTFVVQADPHLDYNSSTAVYRQTQLNELADRPDFMVDLGDVSMVDKCAIDGSTLCATPSPATQAGVWARNALMRSYFDVACHSVPLFIVLGNHDGEAGWTGATTGDTLNAWSLKARNAFYPNPEPDGFYSGNTEQVPGIGFRRNYYAFEWGDALFVVLDPYSYTATKPGSDGWGWTLGATQYQWFAKTLAASRARFKFVFSHHLLGGNGTDARGGTAFAEYFEWGGRNLDGTWAFDTQRPGWSATIHQLLVAHKVTAWFHGHDHLYAREQLDGVVYQEVPQPSLARYDTADPGNGYGYQGTLGVDVFPSSGHLRVTVGTTEVRVEYVRSVVSADETASRKNGTVVTSYVVR
jgi:PKD repeat protein